MPHLMFLRPAPKPLWWTPAHVCMCASNFVNCEFSFTEALIKDPTVSSHHHPACVSLHFTAKALKGNTTFLSLEVHISHRSTRGAETWLMWHCYTCITISCIKATLKTQNSLLILPLSFLLQSFLFIYVYYFKLEQCWFEKSTRSA